MWPYLYHLSDSFIQTLRTCTAPSVLPRRSSTAHCPSTIPDLSPVTVRLAPLCSLRVPPGFVLLRLRSTLYRLSAPPSTTWHLRLVHFLDLLREDAECLSVSLICFQDWNLVQAVNVLFECLVVFLFFVTSCFCIFFYFFCLIAQIKKSWRTRLA